MIPVVSSSIQAVGYEENGPELFVEYIGGAVYAYKDVPAETFQDLLAADSKGTFVNTIVKPNFPIYRRVR